MNKRLSRGVERHTERSTAARPPASPGQGQVTERPPQEEVIKEVTREKRERKIMLKMYTQSSQEDSEHFFECFEKLKKEIGNREGMEGPRVARQNLMMPQYCFKHLTQC
jgi:two-component SAPR family response regulator